MQKQSYDKSASSELRGLSAGETVYLQNDKGFWELARIISKHKNPRAYVVQKQNGGTVVRNRRFLRPTRCSFEPGPPSETELDNDIPEPEAI